MSPPLVAVPLARWHDPASVFAAGPAQSRDAFWLDAGPGAADGWSWVGVGTPEPRSEHVRAVPCATAAAPDDWPAGRFRGGWVGWLGYEPGAEAAGAPVSHEPGVPAERWLRVDRFLAFDHAGRRVWAVAPAADAEAFAREMDAASA